MPQVEGNEPDTLRPYLFHGLDLTWRRRDREAVGTCPWCGREGKFSVKISTGVWRCVRCEAGSEKGGGNVYTFLRMLWEHSSEHTPIEKYKELTEDRGLLNVDTLVQWELVKSITTDDWLVPGFAPNGKLTGLYRYINTGERMALIPTPSLKHHLFGVNLFDKNKETVYLAEGIWEGTSLWEALSCAKLTTDGELVPTSNPKASLLAESNVLAIPSAKVFYEPWCELFANKRVILMAQNDHPLENTKTGNVTPPASYSGMERIARMLSAAAEPALEVSYLYWGENGYDLGLPHGYDVRDRLTKGEEYVPEGE